MMMTWSVTEADSSRMRYNVSKSEPNKPDPANPAIASPFHAGCQWRGVADPGR